ncbi:serine/threonine-protein kinase M1 [Verticillium nonalfalfae]|uniref:non-specific serine/threonine protein kinase n=1 Tax=Verticillium nonalfalfae TaxID=1051616 RepID=A0A3M9Y6J3_9PEZI|nr:serine/threonine-protein kinase M1 [Verticillium nonalfalfae]RNJ56129.1 serine/threonine-protein kinase M1 [Verticillium nonalfalfae]
MATRTGVSGGHAPPSTLAAQLVENISASTKSSRSDDNSELRKLSATIQEVESNPGILKTSEDQLRHNHLLTYVFIRAVLGGIKLNDPFLDRKHLKSEVLQAISFLKLIIKETPAVLAYKTAETPFEMRGDEPLWIWVFPKILRLLGHSRCLDLTDDIETFFYELLDILSSDNTKWCLVSSITVYLREIANALLLRLRDTNTIMNGRDESLQVTLPEDGTLELLVGKATIHTIKQSTYTISGMAVGLRQASSLLKILGHPLVSQQHAMLPDDFFAAHRPWLADSLLSLRALQEGWQHTVPLGRSGVLQSTLNLLAGDFKGTKSIAKRKVYTILALHCADIIQNFSELTTSEGEEATTAQQIFCCALLRLSHAALHDRSIGRLSMAKIVLPAESGLLIQNPSWDKSSDIWRSIQVLKETSGSTPPDMLSPDCQPGLFADLNLQRQVERLGLKTTTESVIEPKPKRRKLSQNSFESTKLPKLVAQIYKILGADPGCSNFSLNWSFMRTLATFVRPPTSNNSDPSYLSHNLKTALSLLKSISEQAVTGFSETNIMAWGQLGRPQISRAIAELLQISVNQLLILIQRFALPWLVLLKKRDVVQKITEARREQDTYFCLMESSNNGPIMALLLIQDAPDPEEFIMSRLREFSSRFESSTIAEMMKSEAVAIILELLKAASDADEERKPRIVHALTWMATKVMAPSREPRSKKHSANIIGRFLESYMLGSISRLVDVINDRMLSAPPVEEQLQCLRAMEEMIRLCKAYVRGARPQITACLLSALERDHLRKAALSCWVALLTHLEEEDIEVLLEPTIFIIKFYWRQYDDSCRAMAVALIHQVLKDFPDVVDRTIKVLPTLKDIPELSGIEAKLSSLRPSLDPRGAFVVFAERLSHQNSGVVLLALEELVEYLKDNQGYLHSSAISEQPDTVVTTLLRSLLDCAAKVGTSDIVVASACTQCIGLIGCLDSNRIETTRESKSMAVLHNFEDSQETTDFVLFILEEVLVKAFLSTTDTRLQGFLSFAMQDLMQKVDLQSALASSTKIPNSTRSAEGNSVYRKWIALPESVREVLSPFLTSRYLLAPAKIPPAEYPIFQPGKSYVQWVRVFVLDLLQRPLNEHARLVFEPLSRLIRVKDVSVAEFLLPYLVIHVIVGNKSTQSERDRVTNELVNILRHQTRDDATYAERDDMKLYCEAVFRVFDYAMKWVQENGRNAKSDLKALDRVKSVVGMISPELRSQRAMDCKEYSRALFYLEHHAQELELKQGDPSERTRLLERLQDIYTQIDEPDGLDGISARLHVLDVNQQILSHRKAGRWTAAQTWYEIKLAEEPSNVDIQVDLLTCLQQSGQHDVLLNHVEGMHLDVTSENRIVPFAVEAAWATSRWDTLSKYAGRFHGDFMEDFNVGIARLFDSMRQGNSTRTKFTETLDLMRKKIASGLTYTATSSLQASHELMLRCHILTDIELITQEREVDGPQHQATLKLLERRLEVLGAYVYDKQYLLSIRRAAMQLSQPIYSDIDISSLWLSTSKLARKANSMQQSLNAVLHASKLGDDSAVIENAKLLWKDGHPRKAIQVLQGAIDANKFATQVNNSTSSSKGMDMQQRYLTARAQLTLAKWLDAAGQTHVINLREKYQQAPKTLSMWEKGHFFLGRHYKKLMESEQTLKLDHQSDAYLQGEIARLVIENYLRSLSYGTKYLFQTLPRILTLWLELGAQVDKPPEGKISVSRELHKRRVEQLNMLHKFLDKYIIKLPAFIFYTALPQIVARIAHPSQHVFDRLKNILVKVVEAHPRQALWGLFGIMTTKQATERRERGQRILQTLRSVSARVENGSYDLKTLLRMGEKLAEQLLLACNNGNFQSNRTTKASITRDLNFNHKCTPCPLVVPIEACLTATLPTLADNVRRYKAFSRDVVTIDSFLDEVLVLGSLAKPRRLTARGSDGKNYMLLIKPKDDLRTDQRLMEFNAMINRSLKRDAESSRRQLYIRTYAVTPLNEECGIIEWVDGLKTLRDILLEQYKMRGTHPDYNAIKRMMKDAVTGTSNIHLFTEGVLGTFPPVLHHWFIEQFPHPAVWFAARLKYTRSCAVMSMVGTILGLGDRHGENVLLEKDNGGIFHVDFNCLFDKGRTFGEPERVPFRLTHNMVTAMGMHGYEGPFRACSELSLGILRQQEETLMTILEAFIYDPTLDLQKVKKSSRAVVAPGEVRLEPPYVVDSIKRKVRGLLPNESIPLGVEGYVEELISQAVDPRNLSAMYIGWCPFL